jgi:hypothetical protein
MLFVVFYKARRSWFYCFVDKIETAKKNLRGHGQLDKVVVLQRRVALALEAQLQVRKHVGGKYVQLKPSGRDGGSLPTECAGGCSTQ